jgi:hypothetical protein
MNQNRTPEETGPARDAESPAYYAVIPAPVLYDRRLPPAAKLLYGQISALANKLGYCWAGNAYFARLNGVSERNVTYWINALRDQGHISVSFSFVPGTNEVRRRFIRIGGDARPPAADTPPPLPPADQTPPPAGDAPRAPDPEPAPDLEPDPAPPEQTPPPPEPRETGLSGTPDRVKFFSPSAATRPAALPVTPENGETAEGTGKNFQPKVKIFSEEGEKIFGEISIYNNILSSSSPPPQPEKEEEDATHKPENEKEKAAPGPVKDAGKKDAAMRLKDALAAMSPLLVFNSSFYPRAASYLASSGLPPDFLHWLFRFCRAKNPKSLTGYFFSLFFSDQAAALFRADRRNQSTPPQPDISCPVCGRLHSAADHECPSCGIGPDHSLDNVAWFKVFFSLPPGKKSAFEREQRRVFSLPAPFTEKRSLLASLSKQFGLPVRMADTSGGNVL